MTAKTRNVQCVVEMRARILLTSTKHAGDQDTRSQECPHACCQAEVPCPQPGGETSEQHRTGVHSREDSGRPTRAGRTGRRARLNEPSPSLATRRSPRSRGEPPLPFLQRGIIAAHDAAGVIASGLGASAAPALSPPAQEITQSAPPASSTQRGGHRAPPCSAQGTPPGWVSGEGGDVGHWGSLVALKGRSLHPPTLI